VTGSPRVRARGESRSAGPVQAPLPARFHSRAACAERRGKPPRRSRVKAGGGGGRERGGGGAGGGGVRGRGRGGAEGGGCFSRVYLCFPRGLAAFELE